MADSLSTMKEAFPPYGLPELYRDDNMDLPDWRSVEQLTPESWHDNKNALFSALKTAYWSKITLHISRELEELYWQDDMKPLITELSTHALPNYHINMGTDPDEAHDRLELQTTNAVDVMIGIAATLGAITNGETAHEDLVAILRASRHLVIQLSSLSFAQFQKLIIESTQKPTNPSSWGWNFNPSFFELSEEREEVRRLRFASGLQDMTVPRDIRLHFGEDGAAITPEIETSEEKVALRTIGQESPYGCPALKLSLAMWDDVVDLIDAFRIYDRNT